MVQAAEQMRFFVAAMLIVAAAALPPVALGDSGGSSSIQQYVEQIPTSSGGATPNSRSGTPIPKQVASAIASKGGSDSGVLTAIASTGVATTPTRSHRQTPHLKTTDLTAASSASTSDGTAATVWVLVALVAVTGILGAAALARRRLVLLSR